MNDTPEIPASESKKPKFSLRMSGRDLVNIGIFAVIYLVVVFSINMLGYINPIVMLFALLSAAFIAAIPFVLFLTRVKHAGMVLIFGVVYMLIFVMMGHSAIGAFIGLIAAIIAEVFLYFGRYQARWSFVAANAAWTLWMVGPMILMILDRSTYLNSKEMVTMKEQNPHWVEQFESLFTWKAVLLLDAGLLVCGLLGGLLAVFMLRKHFQRAGLAN